jgi:hypothetical protein
MSTGKQMVRVKRKKKPPKGIYADGSPKKEKPESAEVQERRHNAMEMRASGIPYVRIAKELGYYDASHAKRDIDKGIAAVEIDAAKMVISQDLAMLDEFKMRCLHALRNNGDLSQIDRIMRIMDKKYSLLGVSEETVRALQSEHGINVQVGAGGSATVQVVQAATETNDEFLAKMMRAVGVDPKSKEAKKLRAHYAEQNRHRTLPMLQGGANSDMDAVKDSTHLGDEEIVDAVIVEEEE